MEQTVKELTCIVCPMGCTLKVTMEGKKVLSVSGNSCPRGAKYAETEMTAPTRVLTSTVRVNGGQISLCPVRTKGAIPKESLFDAMKEVNRIKLTAPVHIGEVVLENIAGSGVDLIATREIFKE